MPMTPAASRLVPAILVTLALASTARPSAAQTSFTLAAEQSPAPKGSVQHDPTTGSFMRSIPIELPAFHGIEPQLALSYSSQGGNSFAGVGWQLTTDLGFFIVHAVGGACVKRMACPT